MAISGGVVVILTPLVSAVTVGIVIGAYWVAGGVVGIAAAIMVPGNRLVRLLVAVLSLLAGIVVLARPGPSLVTLVWFAGAWMLGGGIVMAASAVVGRGRRTLPAG